MYRILLAEDNWLNRRVVTAQLKRFGVEVIAKDDGEEAWDYLKQHQVDLILMDLQMPRLNGIECTERIRNSPEYPNHQTPVIAISAHVSDSIRQACQEAGMQSFLAKPVLQEGLYKVIGQWLNVEKGDQDDR